MRIVRRLLALLVCLAAFSAVLAEPPALESDDDKLLYTLGLVISRNLAQFQFSDADLVKIQAGLADGALGREPRVPPDEFGPQIDAMLQARITTVAEREKEAGTAFRAKIAAEPGAETTDSGMIYRELEPGDGASPAIALQILDVLKPGQLASGQMPLDSRSH